EAESVFDSQIMNRKRLFPVKIDTRYGRISAHNDAGSVPEVCTRRPRTIKDAEGMEMRRSIVDARMKVRHDAWELLPQHLQQDYEPAPKMQPPRLQQHLIPRLQDPPLPPKQQSQPAALKVMVKPKEEEQIPEELRIPE
ncbi:hypothetical protein PFISCL1PPCAC_26606, partial [Pristionchus fissidentatus]